MSEAFHIISDGSCDLPMELTKEKDITVVPFYVSFEEGKYQKEMIEIGVREFYQEMVDHPDVYPKSSMPSVQDYVDAFLPFVKAGIPIICICITTKFSGSMQSALNAKAILEEEYPNVQIYVCDSTVNTVLQGIYVLEAVRLRDAGKSYQESIDRLNEIKSSGRIFFTVGNMEYLKHGGRIGKVASVAGSLLGIKPIITLKEGEIFPSGIGRSRRKTVDKNIDLLLAYFAEEKADIANYNVCVGYGYDYEEAVEFREQTGRQTERKGIRHRHHSHLPDRCHHWRTHRTLSVGNRCREESYLKFISPWQAFNNSCTFSKA